MTPDEEIKEALETLRKEAIVPGCFKCAKCNFVLLQRTLNMGDGTVGANRAPTNCPNCDTPMWPMTWKQNSEELSYSLQTHLDRANQMQEVAHRARPFVHALATGDIILQGGRDQARKLLSELPKEAGWTHPMRMYRQEILLQWAKACFGEEEATNLQQRGIRFSEESIELAQSVGVPKDIMHALIDHIYSRPVGEVSQELGGVGICILLLAQAANYNADKEEWREMERILAKPAEQFAKRNAEKNEAGFKSTTLITQDNTEE